MNETREHVERDSRNDPRSRTHGEEVVADRPAIVADRPQEPDAWPVVPFERRRSDRRRVERTGTDI